MAVPLRISSYFTEPSRQKYLFYLICLLYVIGTSIVVILEPFITLPCNDDGHQSETEFGNVLYHFSKCDNTRYPILLYMTRMETVRGRHLLMAVFFGSLIGYERRSSDRPAGIRTMALVSLGSALFTINSTFGFLNGPMAWDSSRVSAAIPSGVGFLGAGLIVKSSEVDPDTGERHHLVQGITTAAATWLSAAVGIACGGGMYFVAAFTTALNLVLLRFGPRATISDDSSINSRQNNVSSEFQTLVGRDVETGGREQQSRASYSYGTEQRPAEEQVVKTPGSTRSRSSRISRNKPSLL